METILVTGRGASVLEWVRAFAAASGRPVSYRIDIRRAGDLAAYWTAPVYAERELGWRAKYSLDDICRDVWCCQNMNPNGYSVS